MKQKKIFAGKKQRSFFSVLFLAIEQNQASGEADCEYPLNRGGLSEQIKNRFSVAL